jgi:telomere length regulation protein
MTDFLTAVSTKKIASKPIIEEIQDLSIQDAVNIDTVQSALQALKSQPSHGTITNVLNFLSSPNFSLVIPEPGYASIAHELVSNVIPNFWRTLKQHERNAKRLVSTLRNPTGIGHLITRLRSLVAESRQQKPAGTTQGASDFIEDTLDVLARVISGDGVSRLVWEEINSFGKNDIQRKLMWKEYLAQVASGRMLSVRAEAEDTLRAKGIEHSPLSGNDFADWLGRDIVQMLTVDHQNKAYDAALVELSSKALTLGYTGESICKRIRS